MWVRKRPFLPGSTRQGSTWGRRAKPARGELFHTRARGTGRGGSALLSPSGTRGLSGASSRALCVAPQEHRLAFPSAVEIARIVSVRRQPAAELPSAMHVGDAPGVHASQGAGWGLGPPGSPVLTCLPGSPVLTCPSGSPVLMVSDPQPEPRPTPPSQGNSGRSRRANTEPTLTRPRVDPDPAGELGGRAVARGHAAAAVRRMDFGFVLSALQNHGSHPEVKYEGEQDPRASPKP